MALGLALKFYTSVVKGLKLKVQMFLGLIPTFVEVTRGKLVGVVFLPPSILNGVNIAVASGEKVHRGNLCPFVIHFTLGLGNIFGILS